MIRRAAPIIVLLFMTSCAYAYTFHVVPGDAIQDSIDAASSGDTVLVADGTYNESITLKHRVTVCSINGSASTTINGGNSLRTVYSPYTADSLNFGGDVAGFKIDGGTDCGLWFSDSDHVYVQDIQIISDPSIACMYIVGCPNTSRFKNIVVSSGITGYTKALYLDQSDSELEDIFIEDAEYTAILVNRGSPDFSELTVKECGEGLQAYEAGVTIHEDSRFEDCTIGLFAYAYGEYAGLGLDHVTLYNCNTGVSAMANPDEIATVVADSCLFDECDDGLVLVDAYGDIEGCTFEDLDDDGILISGYGACGVIGGSGSDANTFTNIDGVAIHVSTGGYADIDRNVFDYVDETAILVDSGNDDTTIDDCDLDGSGGCFEGINTSGSGTFATVRDCALYDYEAHVTPSPRAAIAYKATACYGTSSDNGNNSFSDNSTDLNYQNRDASPDSLYAVKNWWGENPPDASSFGGRTGYIVYQPYLTSSPRLIPTVAEDVPIPATPMLTSIHPSPSRGTVEFTYGLPCAGRVSIEVYDLTGRLVQRVYDGERPKGNHTAIWDGVSIEGSRAPSGIYVCRFGTTEAGEALRFVLIR